MKTKKKILTAFGKRLLISLFCLFLIIIISIFFYVFNSYSDNNFKLYILNKITVNKEQNNQNIVNFKNKQIEIELSEISDDSSSKNGKWYGLCKKQSINSIEDFKNTVQSDLDLSVYYSGFNWNNAKIGQLKDDVLAHVAHRKGSIITKTQKPIKLSKGDKFITDGTRTVRTFCCNDIILNPSAGNPEIPNGYFIPLIFDYTNKEVHHIIRFPEFDDPEIPGTPIYPNPIPIPTPEPNTALLTFIGLLFIAKLKNKQQN